MRLRLRLVLPPLLLLLLMVMLLLLLLLRRRRRRRRRVAAVAATATRSGWSFSCVDRVVLARNFVYQVHDTSKLSDRRRTGCQNRTLCGCFVFWDESSVFFIV